MRLSESLNANFISIIPLSSLYLPPLSFRPVLEVYFPWYSDDVCQTPVLTDGFPFLVHSYSQTQTFPSHWWGIASTRKSECCKTWRVSRQKLMKHVLTIHCVVTIMHHDGTSLIHLFASSQTWSHSMAVYKGLGCSDLVMATVSYTYCYLHILERRIWN